MSDKSRQELRERIEAEKIRQAARNAKAGAGLARDRLTAVAREHPLLLIAGGLAVGVALSTLIPRSPTRKLSKNAIGMIAGLAEFGMAYGRQAYNAADGASQPARDKLGRAGAAIADGAARLKDRLTPAKAE